MHGSSHFKAKKRKGKRTERKENFKVRSQDSEY